MATQRTREFLDGNHVKYVTISHSPAYTAQEVAASAHVLGSILAKVVVVMIDGKLALAVVPATKQVNFDRLAEITNSSMVRLADREEFVSRFTGCQLGTVPPFGNLFNVDVWVDKELARHERVVFNAGTHTDVISMTFADYRRLAHPKMESFACEPVETSNKFIQI